VGFAINLMGLGLWRNKDLCMERAGQVNNVSNIYLPIFIYTMGIGMFLLCQGSER